MLLVPMIIRAKEEIFDFTMPFTYIFWTSVLLAIAFYFMTHCADPGFVPLDQIALTENSQSCRLQQNGKRSFISQLFKGKGNSHFLNDGVESNKNIGSQNKYDFKVESKNLEDEENIKQKRQQKYLKHVMKSKKSEFIEFKDDEEDEEENQVQINLDMLSDNKTPIKNKVKAQGSTVTPNQGSGNNNNGENFVPECELTLEIEENKQKSIQKSFKFEDSCQSAEKQDFDVGLQDIQSKVRPFSPAESRNRSFENKPNGEEQSQKVKEIATISIQDIDSDFKQSQQQTDTQQRTTSTSKKSYSEKQITIPQNDILSLNILSHNSEKLISKETTTQMEEGSTKFTCKTTTQEQFTTQTLEKKTSPYHPCFKNDDEEEDSSPVMKISQGQTISTKNDEHNITPFQFEGVKNNCEIHEIVSKRGEQLNEKDLTFEQEQKHTHEDNMITDNENNDGKSQRKMRMQTPVSQILFLTNNSNNNPSSMFQFNINSLSQEKNNLKCDGSTKPCSFQEGEERSEIKPHWSKKKNVSKSGDIENNQKMNSDDKNMQLAFASIPNNVQSQLPFVEKRYCTSCYINMPLRTKHCKDCKRCVSKFDHHCPYVGNCIGERNKCVFFWYLIVQLIELTVGFIEILKYNCFGDSDMMAYNVYTFISFIVIAFFFIFVLLLFIYHSYFGSRNITTWEYASWEKISYLQDIPYEFGSPFSMGALKNCKSFCTFRLFKKSQQDPQYVRYPANLIGLQQVRHQQEIQMQNINYLDLNNNKKEQPKYNNTD